jgi:hypothetical protein
MRFSPGFKIAYWLGLIGVLSWFLILRLDEAVAGHANTADALVFGVWIALLLAPLFSEVELLGIKLKQEVEKARDEIKRDILALKTDITSAIDIRTNVSPNIYLSPPPDSQLPTIELQIMRAVEQAFATRHAPSAPGETPGRPLDDDTIFLIATRRDLDIELRRIAKERRLATSDRPLAGIQLSRVLGQAEVLEPDLLRAIRDVYAVCSPAVHGEPVSTAQVAFVRDVAPSLLKVLRAMH